MILILNWKVLFLWFNKDNSGNIQININNHSIAALEEAFDSLNDEFNNCEDLTSIDDYSFEDVKLVELLLNTMIQIFENNQLENNNFLTLEYGC